MGLLLGATIGSFLNVVVYRLPRGLSLANPPKSFCPICRTSLEPADLMPLFSWLLSRGKCRHCGAKVPARYFFVELLNGAIWAGIWWRFFIASEDWVTGCFFLAAASCLVAIIYIDWELYIIPDQLNAALLVIALAYHGTMGTWEIALKGGLLGWGLLWGIAFLGRVAFGKDAMGHGDIKMMRGVGALLGPLLLAANVGIAVILGILGGVAGILLAKRSTVAPQEPVGDAPSEATGEADWQPEPIPDLLILGVYYLLCLDVLACFVPAIERGVLKLLKAPPAPENIEDDDWKPSLTTIPFGPYLAAGAIVCMLFGGVVTQGIQRYWEGAVGSPAATSAGPSGRTPSGPSKPPLADRPTRNITPASSVSPVGASGDTFA